MAKRYFERQEEEGWRSVGGTVCAKCFTDYAIKRFINANRTELGCSYCGRKGKRPIAADMDEVLSFISQGIWREYDTPENTLPYDSSEGGWQLMEPLDSDDVFAGLDIDGTASGKLLEDIVNAFSDSTYVPCEPLILSISDGLKYSWKHFCDHTKHETRFVFFKIKPPRPPKDQASHPDDWVEYSAPYQILIGLGRMVKRYRLIRRLPPHQKIIRARQHGGSYTYTKAVDLGSPPKEKASQSRMSPAGIPMFYGASDENTAFAEIFDPNAHDQDSVTFAVFQTIKELNILDLTRIPEIPSIFDSAHCDRRPALIFLHHFKKEISAAIERDGREHFEYVPTQIVAEYCRRILRFGKQPIHGLMFQSSQHNARICFCIFAKADDCTDGPGASGGHLLSLMSSRKALIDFASASYSFEAHTS